VIKTEYDAIVVGSGPNGLSAAITLKQAGLSVLLIEGKDQVGGGLRSAELTLPGFVHDVSSAVHPMALASPYFQSLPLREHGLEYLHPGLPAAHPLDHGRVAFLARSLDETAEHLGKDQKVYTDLIAALIKSWPGIADDVLGPLSIPSRPVDLAMFGLKAIRSAESLSGRFRTEEARALWAGMAAHAIQPFSNLFSSAIGLVLMTAGHMGGWPVPKGGSQSIADALTSIFLSSGGQIQTGFFVQSLDQLPAARAILFDVTPRQLLGIAGHSFSSIYKWQLQRYRYGMGVFKVDWALNAPIPWRNEACRQAGTVHLGNSFAEIAASENMTAGGKHPEKPFVLLAQPSLFDSSRAPGNRHTAYAYCHVPNGSRQDMTTAIENQVERFAPGFRDTILERHTMDTQQLEAYNPNLVGGDINGGVADIGQLFTRPALGWSPYRTSRRGLYLCSFSTPPGGGVHGMCGHHAARRALKDIFGVDSK
jgi:phytoene dehydrogenase-like protein